MCLPCSKPPHGYSQLVFSPTLQGWNFWRPRCTNPAMDGSVPLRIARRHLVGGVGALALVWGCTDQGKVSAERASAHARFLAPLVDKDLQEVRSGLPKGTPFLEELWSKSETVLDPEAARDGLVKARSKVQDLRVAKSTFFAVAELSGLVVRNDLQMDLMAGKNLFEFFPGLKAAAETGYVETTGSMPDARGTEGKADGQWIAAAVVKHEGAAKGLFVTGWAWTLYARRLEEALKSQLWDEEKGKKPLFYVMVIAGDQAYGTGPTPQVNLDTVARLEPFKNAVSGHFQTKVEITGREFGFAAQSVEGLGPDVMVGVLRSET